MSIATEEAYAQGLVLGVEAAVPLAAGTVAAAERRREAAQQCLATAAKPGRRPRDPTVAATVRAS